MNKVIIIPDSFKGTLSSMEVCDIIGQSITDHYPDCKALKIPVADGGEGTVDAFLYAKKGTAVSEKVCGPYGETLTAKYALLDDGEIAVIEMALCSGLMLVGANMNPSKTTTYGFGQLIESALDRGVKKIILGIGGSATNDGGCGMASALGVEFRDKNENAFIPVGETLKDIEAVDVSGLDRRISEVELITMCDVTNPLYGKKGAAYVFAAQKGADDKMIEKLDIGLMHFSRKLKEYLDKDLDDIPGAGAAGGLGAGTMAFLDASLNSGIDIMLDVVNFKKEVCDSDIVITGEGRIDGQSKDGKVISGLAPICKKAGVPLYAFTGSVIEPIEELYDAGLTAVFPIIKNPDELPVVLDNSKETLKNTVGSVVRLMESNRRY